MAQLSRALSGSHLCCPSSRTRRPSKKSAPARHAGAVSKQGLRASARPCALRGRVHRVERLARGHEQAVALGTAEADVAAHFRRADAAEQLAARRPHRHTVIADGAAGIAGGPDVAVDITAYAVGSALHAVDHAIAELLEVGELVVAADVEHKDLAIAAGPGIARSLAGRRNVELLEVG